MLFLQEQGTIVFRMSHCCPVGRYSLQPHGGRHGRFLQNGLTGVLIGLLATTAQAQSPSTSTVGGLSPASPALASATSATRPPGLQCASAVLIDAESGQTLFELKAHVRRPIASTTKIMTALLLCEHLLDTDVITVSKNAAQTRESSLHLKPGEKLTAHSLLRALMLRSANDGCVAVAEHIAGTEAAFVEMMNRRAREIGAYNTHFVNSHGLHHPDHYSTAADLARIARVALQNERFASVVKLKKARITRSINTSDVFLRNRSRFLGKFPGADGVKTGYTVPAGKCYVGSATYGGWRLISVVLRSKDYVRDTCALMKYGFDNFTPRVIRRAGETVGVCAIRSGFPSEVPVAVRSTLRVVLPRKHARPVQVRSRLDPVTAPVPAGTVVGVLEAMVDGRVVASAPLVTTQDVPVASQFARATRSPWKSWLMGTAILTMGLVSLRYGTRRRIRNTPFAQGARRCRRCLAALLRGLDRRRPGLG
ncbi:MAG: D-alanyl-D-alanine carboxypeptidase family protein [Chloroherpetonaceae bacterium]|nr:D-alanyl-D-alanine carboxypeptidase [Chthonomonadaceae bacterium]MDW8207415.1 D-alanyl-D-alanine carboxypeptidase family protein [Chloroherpetonaceae bacterium]